MEFEEELQKGKIARKLELLKNEFFIGAIFVFLINLSIYHFNQVSESNHDIRRHIMIAFFYIFLFSKIVIMHKILQYKSQ